MARGIVVALTAAALAGCAGQGVEAPDLAAVAESLPRAAPRIVLIGLDGADWSVARPLMAAGKLPTLSGLVASGSSGDLRSIEPMISPALWTSMVTGVSPERHGIRDFVYKQPGVYAQPIVDSTIRERLALWNIFSALGRTVGVVDWYATWPAEQVHGFIVSDRIKTIDPSAAGVTYPAPASFGTLLADPPPLPALPALERLTRGFDPLPAGLDKALREDLYRYRVAKQLYAERRPDFFAFYLKGLDAVGHFYWRFFEPDADVFSGLERGDTARFGSIIPDYYTLCDQLLADFLGGLDEETTVLIASDHGFKPFGRPDNLIFDLDRLFEVLELLEFEDPGLAARRSERRVRMSATQLYAHEGTQIVSALGAREQPVYLNVAGRDPQGVIPADERKRAGAAIKARLEALRTDLGSPLFAAVRFDEAPAGAGLRQEPDLYLRVNAEVAFDHELSIDGRSHDLFDLFFWEYGNISGTHRPEGVVVARGPAIRAGARIGGASLLDIAPTLLYLAGVPVPSDMEGQVLREMLVDSGSAERLRVSSYERWIVREPVEIEAAPLDEEYRERLRALGYVQ